MERSKEIELWRGTEDTLGSADDRNIIAGLFDSCIEFLKALLVKTRKRVSGRFDNSSLEDAIATLFFWGDEFGVSRGDLDKALQRSEETRDLTLSVLISLGEFLTDDLLNGIISSQSDQDDLVHDSLINVYLEKARGVVLDWEEPNSEKSASVEELSSTLKDKVGRLSVLGPILEDPVPDFLDFEEARTPALLQDRPVHQYYAELISRKFPKANPSLVEIHGRCNWERYNYIRKQRETNTTREPSLVGDSEIKSKFHDSGLGTSVPAQSTYAGTVISQRAGLCHAALPPLPDEGKNGKPFLCEVCNKTVNIRRTAAWKKHIFEDILAYVCVFADCPSDGEFFADRETMAAHIGSRHGFAPEWPSTECPLCLEQTGTGRTTISLHFSRHLEEIALGALPRTADSDIGSDTSSQVTRGTIDKEDAQDVVDDHPDPENHRMKPDALADFDAATETDSTDTKHRLARRRKSEKPGDVVHACRDCKKEFKRPCDLTKHEKTHSRPWKCTEEKCKYYELGWPTEKERNRHVSDKHSSAPPQYKCLFPPCTYASKRSSNTNQHMEKAHGWHYVRSKQNGRKQTTNSTGPRPDSPPSPSPPTPLTPFLPSSPLMGFDYPNSFSAAESFNIPATESIGAQNINSALFPAFDLFTSDDGSAHHRLNLANSDMNSNEAQSDYYSDGDSHSEGSPAPDQEVGGLKYPIPVASELRTGILGDPNLDFPDTSRGRSQHIDPKETRSPTPVAPVFYTRTGRISKAKKGTKVHACDDCGKSYTRAEHLRRHRIIHNTSWTHMCDFPDCGKTFYTPDLLERHRERHKIEPSESDRNSRSCSMTLETGKPGDCDNVGGFGVSSDSFIPAVPSHPYADLSHPYTAIEYPINTEPLSPSSPLLVPHVPSEPKPRKLRASCDACSRGKVKCDKLRPTCQRCGVNNIVCHFSPSMRLGKPRKPRNYGTIWHGLVPLDRENAPDNNGDTASQFMRSAAQSPRLFDSSEQPLHQNAVHTSSSAYDEELLSRIGNSPPRTNNPSLAEKAPVRG
jgi:hypothetical protein